MLFELPTLDELREFGHVQPDGDTDYYGLQDALKFYRLRILRQMVEWLNTTYSFGAEDLLSDLQADGIDLEQKEVQKAKEDCEERSRCWCGQPDSNHSIPH